MDAPVPTLTLYADERLGDYNFGPDHPFGPQRLVAFRERCRQLGLEQECRLAGSRVADRDEIERFHTANHVDHVIELSRQGHGFLDYGDTPALPGIHEAAARVVGTVLQAVNDLMHGATRHAFVPIAGLHHARRDAAAGFCVYNDCGVAIETLRRQFAVERVAYVDIDAHHGDGVFYAFESDPDVVIADIHEDGRHLYPGTGAATETGSGPARGTKLNVPMPPGSGDRAFFEIWEYVESFLDNARPAFIILQCGADSLAGDPLTHMAYSTEAHAHAATRLARLADRYAEGRLLAMGGGGYNLANVAAGWCAVVNAMLAPDRAG